MLSTETLGPQLLLTLLFSWVGFFLFWKWSQRRRVKGLAEERRLFEEARLQVALLNQRIGALEDQNTHWQNEAKGERQRFETTQNALNAQELAFCQLKTQLEMESKAHEEKLAFLTATQESLGQHFQNLANGIFEEKSKKFTDVNTQNITGLLGPLSEKIKEFQKKVEDSYTTEGKERSALMYQVKELMNLNQSLSQEAQNLTQALKGSPKTQGTWGEIILERVLESSGLRRGQEFQVQEAHKREDGSRHIPDVVVSMPQNRHLVIDAKVSLNAYEAYSSSQPSEDSSKWSKAHLDSIRSHIKNLSEKKYHTLYSIQTLDFVIMFIPIEPAFLLAISQDPDLFTQAWNRNVLIVSPSTLLFVVRTVAHLWRQEEQSQNAQAISHRGATLYDKFVSFVEDLENVRTRLGQTQDSLDSAYKRLCTGQGNLLFQAEKLKQLGLQPTKKLPQSLPIAED